MTSEHEAKVRRCLDLLEQAQHTVNAAAQALCPVPGFADEWSDLSEAYDCIKKHWYAVDRRYGRYLAKKVEGNGVRSAGR